MTDSKSQAPRNRTASVALTEEEKRDLQLVALVDRTSESDLLRENTLSAIRMRARQLEARMDVPQPKTAA